MEHQGTPWRCARCGTTAGFIRGRSLVLNEGASRCARVVVVDGRVVVRCRSCNTVNVHEAEALTPVQADGAHMHTRDGRCGRMAHLRDPCTGAVSGAGVLAAARVHGESTGAHRSTVRAYRGGAAMSGMGPLPEIHPRFEVTDAAKMELELAVSEWVQNHRGRLTSAELLFVLSSVASGEIGIVLGSLIRTERHGASSDKPRDTA